MATYNKNRYLPNVLTSISKQKTSFPFEVCIVDDFSRVDPEPIIRKHLDPKIELKYKRLTHNVGGRFSRNICLDMADPEADVAIITSCDVIYCQPFLLEELCTNVESGIFTMPEILDLDVPGNMHEKFNLAMDFVLRKWRKGDYNHATVYAGSRRDDDRHFFFLGAIRIDDLKKIGYRENSCDHILDDNIKKLGMKPKFLDHVKAIHQHHKFERHPCREINTCKHSAFCKKRNIGEKQTMKILFYQDLPSVKSTMLTYTLGQELILRGHEVSFGKFNKDEIPPNYFDWVRTGSINSPDGVKLAREIGARVHVHLEGVGYWRVGAEPATQWGYEKDLTKDEIAVWKNRYRSWMSAAYDADSCSVNGANQIKMIQDYLFDGMPLPNCYRLSCGADARYALTLKNIERRNYFVTVSRLEPNKKVMMIAQALAKLDTKKLPPWVIVGDGTDAQIRKIKEFAEKNDIKMIITPHFGARKWLYVRQAKLMLCGWTGICPSESLLCDTPVLSFGHPDIIEMYSDSIWYAKDNDIDDYADKIDKMLNFSDYVLGQEVEMGKQKLLNGELYATTQQLLAEQYENIFLGKAIPWEG